MLSGFNTNVRHHAVLFHVQSEDSGRNHPHVITHLYHGGTILASEKTSYADQVEATDLAAVVKALMERQHKSVLRRLASGEFDGLIRERLGDEIPAGGGDPKGSTRPVPEPAPAPSAAAAREVPGPDTAAVSPREAGERDRSFGAGIVSERPLDEVILDYLVASARQRKRRVQ